MPKTNYWKNDKYTAEWITRYDWAEGLKKDQYNVFLEYLKSYMGILDLDNWIYDSELFINNIFATIEATKTSLITGIIGTFPYFQVTPSKILNRADYETAKEEAVGVQAGLNAQVDYPEFFVTFSDWITQACWWGHSPLKLYYKYDAVIRKFYKPRVNSQTGEKEYTVEEKPVVLWDDLFHEVVNQRNLFYPNEGKFLDDKDWIIERVDRSYNYIERMIELEYYDKRNGKKLLEIMKGGTNWTDYTKEAQERLEMKGLSYTPEQPYASKTMLLECWNRWTNERCVVDYATGIELTPDRINIYGEYPYVGIMPISLPHETEGIGIIQPIYDTQGQINILANLGMDSLMLQLAPPILTDFRSKIEGDTMTAQTGRLIRVYDINNSMKYMVPPNLPQDHWRQITQLQLLSQDISGVNDPAKGLETQGQTGGPAATYIAKQEAASKRIRLMRDIICSTGMSKLAEKSLRFNRIFNREDRFIPNAKKYIDKRIDVIEVKPEMYYRNYRFKVGSSTRADLSPSLRKAMWLELLAIVSKLQPGQLEAEGMRVKLTGIIKQIAQADDIPVEELLETIATPKSQEMAGEMAGMAKALPEGAAGTPPNPQNFGPEGNAMIQRMAQAGIKQ